MKKTLDQLTIAAFVDLVCGDTSVLHGKHEVVKPDTLALTMRNIILEYKEIADPSGSKSYITSMESILKSAMEVELWNICSNMLKVGVTTRVRQVLEEYGISASRLSDNRIEAEIASRLAKAQKALKEAQAEIEQAEGTPQELRRMFDQQTTALMSHFKFQIDTTSMKATLYAHLVARYTSEVKAKMAALKK